MQLLRNGRAKGPSSRLDPTRLRPQSVVSSPSVLRRPTAPRAPTARKPSTVRCSSTVVLLDREYRTELDKPGKFLGTTAVRLSWTYQEGEDDYLEMIRAFAARRPGFPNVSSVCLNAPHLLLSGKMIGEIARSKPWIRELHVHGWAYCDADGAPRWDFERLKNVNITFSGTSSFPSSFDHFSRQLPRGRLTSLSITDSGPHYGPVDCALLPEATDYTSLSNVTLDNSLIMKVRPGTTLRNNCQHGSLLKGWM